MTHTEVLSIVIALSFGVFSIVAVMIALFLWNRGEARTDKRSSEDSIEKLSREVFHLHKRIGKLKRRG